MSRSFVGQLARKLGRGIIDYGVGRPFECLPLHELLAAQQAGRQRHDYTAIGDVVTVASRLEGLTKDTGYPLVCSRSVADAAAGLVALGERAVKGHFPMPVYGWRPGAGEPQPATRPPAAASIGL